MRRAPIVIGGDRGRPRRRAGVPHPAVGHRRRGDPRGGRGRGQPRESATGPGQQSGTAGLVEAATSKARRGERTPARRAAPGQPSGPAVNYSYGVLSVPVTVSGPQDHQGRDRFAGRRRQPPLAVHRPAVHPDPRAAGHAGAEREHPGRVRARATPAPGSSSPCRRRCTLSASVTPARAAAAPPVHLVHHLEEVMGTVVTIDVYTRPRNGAAGPGGRAPRAAAAGRSPSCTGPTRSSAPGSPTARSAGCAAARSAARQAPARGRRGP